MISTKSLFRSYSQANHQAPVGLCPRCDELDVPTFRSLGLKSGVMHLTCPSIIRVYDSDRSNDAATLRPRFNSLNQCSLENMN